MVRCHSALAQRARAALSVFVLSCLGASVLPSCGAQRRPGRERAFARAPRRERNSRSNQIARVPRHHRFEDTVRPKSLATPVRAEWTAPSGKRVLTSGFVDSGAVHVRFAPAELGLYRYRLWAPESGEVLREGSFESVPSADHGPVGVNARSTYGLSHADGTAFFVLGENRINIYDPAWNYERMGIAEYVAYMAGNGMTTLRVFVPSDCEDEDAADGLQKGCLEPRLGHFDEHASRVFDEVLRAAEKFDIYVILTVNAVGFTPGETWKSWDDNPYSRARGGPASSPVETFTRSDLFEAAKRKLEYVINRYGYSSHLLAIDLLNEPEWDGALPESAWMPWAQRLAEHLRSVDPYAHPITVGSVGLSWNIEGDERALYRGPDVDLIQWHLYGKETYDPHDHALEMARRVEETLPYEKPIFCGEFAYGGEDPALYDHTHTGLWAALFAGGGALAHSAPPFNIDSDEPMTPARAHHFQVLSQFLRGLDLSGRLAPKRLSFPSADGTSVEPRP